MGQRNILAAFIAIDFVFLLTGGMILAFAIVSEQDIAPGQQLDANNTARDILLSRCPLAGLLSL